MRPAVRILASLLASVGFVAATRAALADPLARAELQYAAVLTLGYGHLLGAVRRTRVRGDLLGAVRRTGVPGLLGLVVVADLLCVYILALQAFPALVSLLFAVSTWHAFENEHALARGASGARLPGLARGAGSHVLLGLAAAGSVAAGLHLGIGPAGLTFSDVFTVATLHHLLSWLLHTSVHARRRALASHAVAALLLSPLLVLESAWLAPLRAAALSPALYLFWSSLHVVQTAWRRGLERV